MANPQMPEKNPSSGAQQNRKADVPPKFSEDTHKEHQATEVSNPKADTEPGLDRRASEADPSLRPLGQTEVNQAKSTSSNVGEEPFNVDDETDFEVSGRESLINKDSNDRRGNNSTH
ncbi:hypothetical protein [Bdellovibrio sp. HCB209]|uniref:hypothetical protein n=1 Tax=Bdellovibrio sp. HCB209 TaxID=3394354 RepID=UPI0039B52E33